MASAWGGSWGTSWRSSWGGVAVAGALRLLDVHGAMPPSEFGPEIPAGVPAASIPAIEAISVVNPVYRKLTLQGVLEE